MERAAVHLLEVVVDDTDLGRFRDPSFLCTRGTMYTGFGPLLDYFNALDRGVQDPVVANPIGDSLQVLRILQDEGYPALVPELRDSYLVGPYFSEASLTHAED
jgi:hypothetical protein